MCNLPIGADIDPSAPYNEKSHNVPDECSECEGTMEYFDSGEYRGIEWIAVKCTECGHIESTEPDYD